MRLTAGPNIWQTRKVQCAALFLVLTTYFFARETAVSSVERESLASRFHFTRHEISVAPFDAAGLRSTRKVHPSLERIKSWIGATGAAATLADLDGDGLCNELLLVDTRVDRVVIRPVPGIGDRFTPFTLDGGSAPFDANTMSPAGTLVGDFNEDGHADVLLYYWGRTPLLFLRTPGKPLVAPPSLESAAFKAIELVPLVGNHPPEKWYTHAATQADVDGDGHFDLILGNFFQDGADILNEKGTGVATVMHSGKSKATNGGGAKLFLWESAGRGATSSVSYRNATEFVERHCGRGWVLAVGAADLDQDGLPEIYLANDFGPDRLLHNRSTPGQPEFAICEGTRNFTTPKSCVLGRDSFKGMGLDFGDVNSDGIFDIYVSNIADNWALQESHFLWISTGSIGDFKRGVAPYAQQSERYGVSRSGWGWDSRLADFDNDGTLEAIQATGFAKGTIPRWPELQALGTTNDRMIHDPRFWPRFEPPTADLSGHNVNPFYVKGKSGRFVNVAAELGIDDYFNTRGIAIADVDGDGLLDFVYANQWEPSFYFHNECPGTNSFIGLHLLLPLMSDGAAPLTIRQGHPGADTRGRPAIGAVATMTSSDGTKRIAQLDGGSGHSGRGSQTIHFGLGRAIEGVEVDLRWRAIDGSLASAAVRLQPGWHTVLLGNSEEKGDR